MNTTSWNYQNGGDDIHRHNRLRAATTPVAAYPIHPMSLMPGQAPLTSRPNFHFTDASRRMSIADDIRNAHNIPSSAPPPLPPYPAFIAAEFPHRPAPPAPSSSSPPPRPPLPPSLTASMLLSTSMPPPIPPKPFSTPFSQEDGRPTLTVSTLPKSLTPGGQSTSLQTEESDIAAALVLSASASKEEENLRQKLASQEEEDLVRALEASILETRAPDRSHVGLDSEFASSSRDPLSVTSQWAHNGSSGSSMHNISTLIRPADCVHVGQSSSGTVPNPFIEDDACNDVGSPALKQERLALLMMLSQSASSKDPELPDYSPGGIKGHLGSVTLPVAQPQANNNAVDITSIHTPPKDYGSRIPSPSHLSYLLPVDEHDGDVTPRAEKGAGAPPHLNNHSNPLTMTTYPSGLSELIRNGTASASAASGSVSHTTGHESNITIDTTSPIPAYASSSSALGTTSGLPGYSPRNIPPKDLPPESSTDSNTSHSHPGTSLITDSFGPDIVDSSQTVDYINATLPTYTEAPPINATELPIRDETLPNEYSSTSTQETAQSASHTTLSRPHSTSTSSISSMSSSTHHYPSSVALRADASMSSNRISRLSSTTPSDLLEDDDNSARASNSSLNLNAFVNKQLYSGVSIGFMAPKISSQLIPMAEEMPPIISLPYGKARPLHLHGPSWRHLLKLMAMLSGTRMEPSLDALAAIKTPHKLRTVVQFVKPHQASPVWRTIFYFTIDYPPPQPQVRHRSVNELPYSYSLTGIPTLLRDATDSLISKTYTIPASTAVPFPTLPITFPDLAMYMQAALEESRRYLNDSHSDYRKLAKIIKLCYPDEDVPQDSSERRGLFQRVMGRSSKNLRRGGNEDTYEFVTPFVPDEWG